jgi:two-component system, NarL family, sensor histidine kinase UhpB
MERGLPIQHWSSWIVLVDTDRTILFLSQPPPSRTAEAAVGTPICSLLTAAAARRLNRALDLLLVERVATSVSVQLELLQSNTGIFEASVVPVLVDGKVAGASIVAADIPHGPQLQKEILEVSNREQARLGHDLHDGLGQELTGIALMLKSLASRLRRRGVYLADEAEDAEQIVGLVNQAISSARGLARGLAALDAVRGGLVSGLRAMAARAREVYKVDVIFRSKIWPRITLDATAANHLYRIAQEGLSNAVRHGRASKVIIRLNATGPQFQLSIADDGVGFDADSPLSSGMGRKIMSYRANMIGAEFGISSRRALGTVVTVSGRQPDDCLEPPCVQ